MKKDDVIETFTLLQTDENTKKIFDADISARIPYRLHCCVYNFHREVWVEDDILYNYDLGGNCQTLKILNEYGACLMYYQIRPYLRPMSSMTEEERVKFSKLLDVRYCKDDWKGHYYISYCIEIYNGYTDSEGIIKYPSSFSMDAIDWLNSHHFDYRGLIEKGLALEAPEGMYNIPFHGKNR